MGVKLHNELRLDWLSFTYKANIEDIPQGMCEFDMFLSEFPKIRENLGDSLVLDRSRFYEHVLKIDKNIVISYSDEDKSGFGQGVHVTIPGSGLAILFDWFDLPDDKDTLICLFEHLKNHHCQLSRIDIAYDDFDKIITPYQYAKWKLEKNMVTHFNKFQFVACDSEKGSTFYLGSRKTGKMLRIYDKDYESNGQVPSIRYEFELRKEYAKDFMDFILQGNDFDFVNYLLSWFDVKDLSKHKNRSEAPRLEEFDSFVKKQIFFREIQNDDATAITNYFNKKIHNTS